MEAWLNLKPGERSTAQAPESIQSAAQRWAVMQKSPDYQDHVIGQVRANNPQAKDQLVKDWMAAGSPEVRPFDPEFRTPDTAIFSVCDSSGLASIFRPTNRGNLGFSPPSLAGDTTLIFSQILAGHRTCDSKISGNRRIC